MKEALAASCSFFHFVLPFHLLHSTHTLVCFSDKCAKTVVFQMLLLFSRTLDYSLAVGWVMAEVITVGESGGLLQIFQDTQKYNNIFCD